MKATRCPSSIAVLLAALLAGTTVAQRPAIDMDARTQQLQAQRFGMFICWSFSTFTNVEWTRGVKDLSWFDPSGCDTDQWCRVAKDAGMGYVLFLTKHHDGFCLWDTATTAWKVTESPLGFDVLERVRRSCERHGLKLALYFSEGDWTWPGKQGDRSGPDPEMKKAQLRELLTGYGPIEFLWFDHATGDGGLDHAETVRFCKSLQPGCFVGFNHGAAGGDIRLGEMAKPGALDDVTTMKYGANEATGYRGYRLAEFTYPILGGRGAGRWFYTMPEWDQRCVSAEDVYRDYLGAQEHGNIFSLDVAPMRDGRLRPIDVATLAEVGRYVRGEIELPPMPVSRGKTARASGCWQDDPAFAATAAFDGDPDTRWGAPEDARDGWLEVDLEHAVTIGRAVIDEGDWDRVRHFVLEARIADEWRQIAAGTRIPGVVELRFEPVVAQVFRLRIDAAAEVPTICELQLFER